MDPNMHKIAETQKSQMSIKSSADVVSALNRDLNVGATLV